jgi:CheY-like chemotaxis protein
MPGISVSLVMIVVQSRSGKRLNLGYAPRILIVDDEYSVQVLFERVLSDVGYYVTLVGTGRHAMTQVCDREFDVVIVDLSLPDRDGLEVIRQIRSECPRVPILAVSGFMVGDMKKDAIGAGATETLPKPASPRRLLEAVYRLIEPRGTWAASGGATFS